MANFKFEDTYKKIESLFDELNKNANDIAIGISCSDVELADTELDRITTQLDSQIGQAIYSLNKCKDTYNKLVDRLCYKPKTISKKKLIKIKTECMERLDELESIKFVMPDDRIVTLERPDKTTFNFFFNPNDRFISVDVLFEKRRYV